MATETWYVLEDGTYADPNEVTADDKGRLRHSRGAVAYGDHGNPRTRSLDPDEERAAAKASAKEAKAEAKEAKAEAEARVLEADKPKAGYTTREVKAKD